MKTQNDLRYPYYNLQGEQIGWQDKEGTIKELDPDLKREKVLDGYGKPAGFVDEKPAIAEAMETANPKRPMLDKPLKEQTLYYVSRVRDVTAGRATTAEIIKEVSPEAVEMGTKLLEEMAKDHLAEKEPSKVEKALKEFEENYVKEHIPVTTQILKGLAKIPGQELLKPLRTVDYLEPFQLVKHFDPETRKRLQEKFQTLKELEKQGKKKEAKPLRDELFDHHPVYERYTVLQEQALAIIGFWNEWYKIAKSITDWHIANLEDPSIMPPPYVTENLDLRLTEKEKKEKFLSGQLTVEDPAKPGLFGRVPTKPKDKPNKHVFHYVDEDGIETIGVTHPEKLEKEKHRLDWIKELKEQENA